MARAQVRRLAARNLGLDLVELPTEYVLAETGQRPVFGYHIWSDFNGEAQYWYFTSHPIDITLGGQDWSAQACFRRMVREAVACWYDVTRDGAGNRQVIGLAVPISGFFLTLYAVIGLVERIARLRAAPTGGGPEPVVGKDIV